MPLYSKDQLLNEINAIKSLNEAFRKIKSGNSFPSLNSKNDGLAFLLDILKTLVGFEQIKNETINFLTFNVLPIEVTIKTLLKELLKKTFSCSNDAVLPDFLFTDGILIPVKQIDFFDLFKIDPTSDVGTMLYGSQQEDLNHFLYTVIQGNEAYWKNIVLVKYLPNGIVNGQYFNHVLSVKIHPGYSGKTVNTFINNFVDSITFLELPLLINRIFDNLFGVISLKMGKSFAQIQAENELDALIEKVVDLPDTIIDNSYYEFSQANINYLEKMTAQRKRGVTQFITCYDIYSEVDTNDLIDLTSNLEGVATLSEIKTIIDNKFEILTTQMVGDIDDTNKSNSILEFYMKFFKGIIKGIMNVFLSPKVMFMFLTYYKIVNVTSSFKTAKDFFEEHKQFFVDIIRTIILPIIIEFLIKIILKYIKKLIVEENINKNAEKFKYYQLQILSLLGVPDRIANLILKRI